MEGLVFIIVLAVLLVAALVAFGVFASKSRKREQSIREDAAAKLEATQKEAEDRLYAARTEAEIKQSAMQSEITTLTGEKAALDARLEASISAQKAIEEQREAAFAQEREQMAKALDEMKNAFKVLSAENSEHFKKQSAESIDELLKPVREKFDAFDKSMRESDVKNAERSVSLEQMIKLLDERSQSVGNQAQALADAITGQSKVQGDFGEMLLIDLLKESGLEEGVNFDKQSVLRDEDGHEIKSDDGGTMIPDVIVHYPDGGEVIIDSKVSLKAFVAWNAATTADERSRLAKEHIASVRKHVDELRGKDYASYIPEGKKKIDYNLMFIPIEGAFRLMQEEAPLLWQQAKNQGVLIVSQMSLAIVLNMVLIAWRQHDQQKNINEVYQTASELMTALQKWMESYTKIGDYLGKLNQSYSDSTKALKESSQSVVKKIGKLEKLRVTPKRSKAATKTSGRMVGGKESIIPAILAQDSPDD